MKIRQMSAPSRVAIDGAVRVSNDVEVLLGNLTEALTAPVALRHCATRRPHWTPSWKTSPLEAPR